MSWCPACCKQLFSTRRTARAQIRKMHGVGMREYRCPNQNQYFHIGHLPQATRHGRLTVSEVYGRLSA